MQYLRLDSGCWVFFSLFVCFKEKCLFVDLGTAFNEAIGVLDELQNPRILAYVDTLGFLNWAQSHTSRRLRDPTGAAPAAKRTDNFQGFPLLQLDSQGMGQKASSRDTKGKIGALGELSW